MVYGLLCNCGNCKFGKLEEGDNIRCVRYPPVNHSYYHPALERVIYETAQSYVSKDMYCGEWKDKRYKCYGE